MAKHVCILIMLAMCGIVPAHAQSDDFGIWSEADFEKKINKKLTLDGSLELRTRDDGFGELDRWSVGVGATYKLTDWLKASVGYSFLNDNNHKVYKDGLLYADYWGQRHRLNVSLTASQDFGKLSVSLRERWQYTYRPEQTVERYGAKTIERIDLYEDELYDEKISKGTGSNKWRNRLQLKYKLSKQWRPYVNAESTVSGSGLDKIRYAAGTEYRLSKKHSFDLRYIYQHAYKDDEEGNRHVLGIGYTYSF